MLKLIKPSKEYFKQYKEMMDEWNMEGSSISPWPLKMKYHKEEFFYDMLKTVKKSETQKEKDEYSTTSTFWLYEDEEDKLIGASNLRHYLTDYGVKTWGHIGYGIRPSERRKGYATKLLNMTLKEAKNRGIRRVLLGAYVGNIPSWKVMEKCGGKLERIIIEEETGLPIKQYWISLKKRYASTLKIYDNIKQIEQKYLKIKENDFEGFIYLHNFLKISDPFILKEGPEKGVCIQDTGYKWLEFFDCNSKIKLTSIYDENNKIIEWYFDISREISTKNGEPYHDDFYLDVVFRPDGKIFLLDEDEFEEAFERKEMTKEEYDEGYRLAYNLMERLKGKETQIEKFTDKYLNKIL